MRLRPLFCALLLAAPSLPAAGAPGKAGCGTGSWIGGSIEICDGVYTYRDYVYDDYGATVGSPNTGTSAGADTGTLSKTDGRVRYTTTDVNSADLVALRLWIDGDQLHVSFELNTLLDASSTTAALAIDTDDDSATGGGPWADLTAVEQPHGSGVQLLPLVSTGWDELPLFETGDPATNRIEGAIPLPPGSHWRVQAVTAIRDRRVVMNVAFRGGHEDQPPTTFQNGLWFEEQQSLALTSGDISRFGAVVDVSKLEAGVTELAPAATGYHERIYESDFTIAYDETTGEYHYDRDAEGMSYEGLPPGAPSFARAWHFFGKYQPYGIYIPATQSPPHGMQLALHGYAANHASLINQAGLQQNVGEARNRILVVPLGRGPESWYNEISERDVLDVMADVEANYPVDPERVFAGGYSMGGYGTYRLATLYPHRFAGFIGWVGALSGGGDKGISTLDFFGNLRDVPGAMLYSGGDELVNVASYLAIQARTEELGHEHILYFHPAADHFTYAVADDWTKESLWTAGRTRETQPARVTYRTEPWVWNGELGVVHDRAYWVSQIRGANTGPGDYVDVDVQSSGCGGSLPLTSRTVPDPQGEDPVPWTAQEFTVTGDDPIVPDERLWAEFANVASLEIALTDFGGSCLAGDLIGYDITTDGAVTVAFSDGNALAFPGAGRYTGTLPEPDGFAAWGPGALAVVALRARRRRIR